MPEPEMLDIPSPPLAAEHKFFFVYGEWVQVIKQGSALSLEPSEQRSLAKKIGMNEVINMPPEVWSIMAQQRRPGYTIKWARGISEPMFLWYRDVQARIQGALNAKEAQQEG